jgi:hypothetical protein
MEMTQCGRRWIEMKIMYRGDKPSGSRVVGVVHQHRLYVDIKMPLRIIG